MQQAFKFQGQKSNNPPSVTLPKVDYDFPQNLREWHGIAMVGEAPGADEVRLGHPFVGRSGQLLGKVLEKAEIERNKSFVGNVFRFQPPGNKVDHFFISRRLASQQGIPIAEGFGQFGSAFCRAEFAGEIENLQTTLKDLKPKVLIALGRTPLWALTGENQLLKKVGTALPCRLLSNIKVIPTYHPSFILRGNWGLQDKWLSHFIKAKEYI